MYHPYRHSLDLWQQQQQQQQQHEHQNPQIADARDPPYFWQNTTMSLVNEIPPHCRLEPPVSDTVMNASLCPPCTPPTIQIPWSITPSTTCPLVSKFEPNFDGSTNEAPASCDRAPLQPSSQTAHTRPLDGPALTPSFTSSLSTAHSHSGGWFCSSDEISSAAPTVQQPLPLFPHLDISRFETTGVMNPPPLPTPSLHPSASYTRFYLPDGTWPSTIAQNAADAASYPPCYTHDSAVQQPIQSNYPNTLQGTATDMHWAQGHSPQLEYPISKHSCGEMAMQHSSPPVSGVSADPARISANDFPQRSWANGHTLVARRRSYPDSSQSAVGYPYTNSHRRLGTLTDIPRVPSRHYSSQFLLQQGLSNGLVKDPLYPKTQQPVETPAPIHHAPSSSSIAPHQDVPYSHPETEVITVPSQSYPPEAPSASQPHLGVPIMTRPNPPFPPVCSDSSGTGTTTSTATTSAPSSHSHCPPSVGPSRVGQGDSSPPVTVHQPTAEELKKQRLKDRRFVIACSFCKGRKIRCKPLQPSIVRERAMTAVTFWSNEKDESPLNGEKPAGLDLPPCANCIRRGTPCHYPLRKEKRAPAPAVPPNERPFIPAYSVSSVSGTPRSTSGSSQAHHSPNAEKRVAI